MYGELDLENKKIIINSLIETTKDPHESRSWCFSGRESESLLDLIKLHPKTPDELKEIIKQNTKT